MIFLQGFIKLIKASPRNRADKNVWKNNNNNKKKKKKKKNSEKET